MTRPLTVAAVLAAFSLTLAGLGPVQREGDGERRTTLNAMEAKPFPAEAIERLTVEPGPVTVYVTVFHQEPKSLLALLRIERIKEKLGADNVRVIGVVHPVSWEVVSMRQKIGKITSELSIDEDEAFRKTMLSDDEPDIYVMDRAGQLRYADIDIESVESAIEELVGETAEQAAGELARREAAIAAGETVFATKPITLDDIPASAYAEANWPKHNAARALNAMNRQGKTLPRPLGNEEWLSEKDREPTGHVLVLDFWATWCGPCIAAQPELEKVQAKFKDDVMVLAIAGGEEKGTVEGFLRKNKKNYYNLFDEHQTLASALQVQAIPHTVIVSTDGVVRWQGNPLAERNFEKIVAQVVAEDPYLKAKHAGGVSDAGATGNAAAQAYASQKWPDKNTGDLYATDVQGQTLDTPLSGLEWLDGDAVNAEGKVTILDFWATWCGPCIRFSPTLDAVQKRFADDVVAVGISGQGEPKSTVLEDLGSHSSSYRHAHAEDQRLYKQLGISGIPHVVILSSDGVVRWQGFPGAVPDFQGLVAKIVMADRKAREQAAGE